MADQKRPPSYFLLRSVSEREKEPWGEGEGEAPLGWHGSSWVAAGGTGRGWGGRRMYIDAASFLGAAALCSGKAAHTHKGDKDQRASGVHLKF